MKYLFLKLFHNIIFLCMLSSFVMVFIDGEIHYVEAKSPKSITSIEQEKSDYLYRIGSGDILDIITWKEPDFSLENILVRSDGNISFPLLNDIKAAGKTPMVLKKDIETGLKLFIDNPVVTIMIRNPLSQRFYIIGEVVHTGEYPLTKELTILQALAIAGGFTEWAAKNEIILLRSENGKEKIIRIQYFNIIKGKDITQNVRIQANDTIIVP